MTGLTKSDWDSIVKASEEKPVTELESYDFSLITSNDCQYKRFVIRNNSKFYNVRTEITLNNINSIFGV